MEMKCVDPYQMDSCEPCLTCEARGKHCAHYQVNVGHGVFCQWCDLFETPLCNHPEDANVDSHDGLERTVYYPPYGLKTGQRKIREYLRERQKEPSWLSSSPKKWIHEDGKFPVIRYGDTCYVYGIPPCLAIQWVYCLYGSTGLFNNLHIAQEIADFVVTEFGLDPYVEDEGE